MGGDEPLKMENSNKETSVKPPPIMSPPPPSSPAPLLRPPVPGANRRGGVRTPQLGLAIPPSPSQRPVGNSATAPGVPALQAPPSGRPAPPQLRLATPLGSHGTPHEAASTNRPYPVAASSSALGGIAGSGDDASAHSRTGSFGMLDGKASVPSSASSASHSALSFANARQSGGTPDPASAISSIYSHDGGAASDRGGSDATQHILPDLEKLSLEKGRDLDVDDLDDDGWLAASKSGRIEELGTLGEGAGGAVTKCRLKGGKTVFALKVPLCLPRTVLAIVL